LKKVEYSQIVRRKLKALRVRLTKEFGSEVSRKSIKQITDAIRGLANFEAKGISIEAIYGIECDYRYIYAGRNYLFYRIETNKIIIVEMFDDREDFMYKLFGITTTTQESIDYWDE
jgi:plasmid stabilization system protein ParE